MKKLLLTTVTLLCVYTTSSPWKYCTKNNNYLAGYHHVSMNVCNNTAALKNKQSICSCSDDQLAIDALKTGCLQTLKKLALTKQALEKKLAELQ